MFHTNRGEFRTSRELSEQMMHVAQSAQDQYLLSLAHMCLGAVLYWLGELVSARTLLEQTSAMFIFQ